MQVLACQALSAAHLDVVDGESERRGDQLQRWREAEPCMIQLRLIGRRRGILPNPIMSNSISGESRDEQSANSLILRLSSRRWIEASTIGIASVMKPGLQPVA